MKGVSFHKIFSGSAPVHAGLAVATIALAVAAWWAGNQVHAAQTRAEQRNQAAMNLLAKAEHLRAEWKSAEEQYAAVTSEVDELRAKLPEKADEAIFLQQVSDLAKEHQVTLSEFRPGVALKREDHQEMELRLRSSGKYADLCRWLVSIERLPRMSRVSQLTVVAPRTADGDCTLDFQINLLFGLVQKSETSKTVSP